MKRRIPQEIKSYKSQLFFGLSTRQVLCGIGALAVGIPTGLLCSHFNISPDTTSVICMLVVAPFGLVGWVTYNNMPFEVYAKKIYNFYFAPQKRKWQYEYPEAKLHDVIIDLEYQELNFARKNEIAEDKLRLKSERRQYKADLKKQRKDKIKVKEDVS